MGLAQLLGFISEEEYLRGEELALEKHEYVNGMVFKKYGASGMAGGTRQHATIAGNIHGALHNALRGKKCRPYIENMKLRVQRASETRFFYPDVMVVCEPSTSDVWEDKPVVIFEVLSESTEREDMGDKRAAYLAIPSLAAYVLLDSRNVDALVIRQDGASWTSTPLRELADVIELPEIGASLPLSAAYEGVF